MQQELIVQGRFFWSIEEPSGRIRARGHMANGIATAALNDALEVLFRAGSQRTTWYGGLIDLASYSALAAADTMSSHAGWVESTDYSESTRPQWSPGAASGGVIINSSAMSFTLNAAKTLVGLFVASNSTKGGTSGLLWSTGLFDDNQVMASGEVLKVFYQLTAAAGVGS